MCSKKQGKKYTIYVLEVYFSLVVVRLSMIAYILEEEVDRLNSSTERKLLDTVMHCGFTNDGRMTQTSIELTKHCFKSLP